MSEETIINGTRYLKDGIGWIWRENANPTPERPERWLRTGYASLDHVEQVRSRDAG